MPLIDAGTPVETFDLLVIGSGAAGLSVALGASGRRVCVVTPGRIGHDGSSALAQGGIAAAVGEGDAPRLHADDTLVAGAGRNDAAQVTRLTAAAPGLIGWLLQLGCPLDRRDDGGLLLGLEAAHSRPRIVHAGGDRSGALLMQTLARAVRHQPGVTLREGSRALAPLLSGDGVVGARVRAPDGRVHDIRAGSTVLASGGLSALFGRYTGSLHADGSGHCFALAAGASMRDLEFLQFHPTAFAGRLACDGPLPLLTEALRGAGARLRDAAGRALFGSGDALGGDLGPRDHVARAVHRASLDAGAFLDLRDIPVDTLATGFPTAAALCREHRIDPARQPLPVSAAAHYHMGGVSVDARHATCVPGLYAVGEVACSGVHGANRLASNSLLEALAFGRDLGVRLAQAVSLPRSASARAHAAAPVADRLAPAMRQRIGATLWHAAGPLRDAAGIAVGLDALERLVVGAADDPAVTARIRLAQALLQAALARDASLGAHWRLDAVGPATAAASRAA